jgi:ATP-binding cassette, subfamily B, bacterial CvaB/MchF/RaxB
MSLAGSCFSTESAQAGGRQRALIKIMVGLLEPTCGEVLIDGIPVSTLGNKAYREQIGVVMQEDQLLSGSIADNICFFDTAFDSERMIRCAQQMGYMMRLWRCL